ncbi:MAG: virulence RhuM family protein [Methanobrevibacter sp.]|jgi:hypothetical protein|nr:virulence RhuM family protein [Methanobrevibacter sp.]
MTKFDLIKTLSYYGQETTVEGDFIIGEDTIWASRNIVANIFGTTAQNISSHFKNIIEEGELIEKEVSISSKDLFKEQIEFSKKNLQKSKNRGRPQIWYNLDAMISIGYRINSKEATHFRKWATNILREYMIKGYVLNKEVLENGGVLGKDYFDELLEEIKEIRTSERRAYQKVTDIFATSYDYDSNSYIAKEFYAKVQNKLHYAITGHTAAEIISSRADHEKNNMGLQTWKNSPSGKILKSDTEIAKNYLDKEELDELNSLVNMYLDYAELQAKRQKLMYMDDWSQRLDGFLDFNEYDILENKGNISMKEAKEIANNEYDKFRPMQDKNYRSDFDKLLENIKEIK